MENVRKYYVYVHRRITDGEIFYVGKGQGDRAWSTDDRTRVWIRMVADHGRRVEIIGSFDHERMALALEAMAIAMYKSTTGACPLVNNKNPKVPDIPELD